MGFIFLILNRSKKECVIFAEFEYVEKVVFIFLTLNKSEKGWIFFAEFEYVKTVVFIS